MKLFSKQSYIILQQAIFIEFCQKIKFIILQESFINDKISNNETASIFLIDYQKSQQEFLNNLLKFEFCIDIIHQKIRKINLYQKIIDLNFLPKTEIIKVIITLNLLQLYNFNSIKKIFLSCLLVLRACKRLLKQFCKVQKMQFQVQKDYQVVKIITETVLNGIQLVLGNQQKIIILLNFLSFDNLKNPQFHIKATTSKQLIKKLNFNLRV
ncbi:unnamed protein product [Paramecium sonneborni]|uniref:Uncharacterized protein n=1 Tax=Paramecium sonneborni TaxID=65129 RepID=A0A8S1M3N9_9CILI|nr:unnamed protein product [Paramecium sonneborni]